MTAEEQLRVLKMVQDGTISADEAERLLRALDAAQESPAPAPPVEVPLPHPARYVFIAGCLLTALATVPLALHYAGPTPHRTPVGGIILLTLGLLTVGAGWLLARSTWLRIRVSNRRHGEPGVDLALPVPLGFAAWCVRMARPFVHQFDLTGIDEVILSLRDEMHAGRPLAIDVTETDEGERVQVYMMGGYGHS